jgi:hypothetical protein
MVKSVSRIDEIVYARSALSISSIDVVVGFCDDEHQGPGPKLRQCPRWTSSDAVLAPMSRLVVITRLALQALPITEAAWASPPGDATMAMRSAAFRLFRPGLIGKSQLSQFHE